jgi:peptidoglycan hydrolase-like protein with peptidoglycan-binding domain
MRRIRIAGPIAVLVAAGAVLAVGYAVTARPRAASDGNATAASVRTGTATVTRGTVTERVQISGTLGYDGSYIVVNHAVPGTVTAVADPGGSVDRGGVLYAVATEPVRLLFGATPVYRDFASGMADGPDVRQLEENLVALGMDPSRQITVDSHFSASTAAAIRRWQASWGWPARRRTGTLSQAAVVFLPGAVRVSQVQAAVGSTVRPDEPVLSATSTSRVVTAQVTTDRQAFVHVGDRVLVTLAGRTPVQGTVTRIGRVATAAGGNNGIGGNGNGGPSGPLTIPVTVGVTMPADSADLDQAPVQVAITTAAHPNVLLVPVTALRARPGGGYQVRLAGGGYVEVQPGLFDDSAGLVEVSGTGLEAGQLVEVPAS